MTEGRLRGGRPEERATALVQLAARTAPPTAAEIDALVECVGDTSKLVQRRAAEALATLAKRGVDVAPRLRERSAQGEVRARWGAVYALSLLGPLPTAALPTLLAVIGLDDGDLRWAAADQLKRLAATERQPVVAALIEAAAAPGPARKMALYCLRDLEVYEALAMAEGALDDPVIDVRLAALAAITVLDRDREHCAERIVGLVDNPDPRLQRAAAGTLGGVGIATPTVVAALSRAEQSDDASLRRAAQQAKRRLGVRV